MVAPLKQRRIDKVLELSGLLPDECLPERRKHRWDSTSRGLDEKNAWKS